MSLPEKIVSDYQLAETIFSTVVGQLVQQYSFPEPLYDFNKIKICFGKRILKNCITTFNLSTPTQTNEGGFFFDTSSVCALARNVMDTYATFYHLFVYGNTGEQELRQYLWILDSLSQRTNSKLFKRKEEIDPVGIWGIEETLHMDLKEMEYAEDVIRNNTVFNSWESKIQTHVLKYCNWKYTNDPKQITNWKQLLINTGINADVFEDLYGLFSTHTHSGLLSLVQDDQIGKDTFHEISNSCRFWLTITLVSMIHDYSKMFITVKKYVDSIAPKDKNILSSIYRDVRWDPKML